MHEKLMDTIELDLRQILREAIEIRQYYVAKGAIIEIIKHIEYLGGIGV